MAHNPLGRVPKNRKRPATQMMGTYVKPETQITITEEEYKDFCNMRDFIYDNNLVMTFETYVDVKAHMDMIDDLNNEEEQ